jgi:L-threonylcarbamoyladenylate synthase
MPRIVKIDPANPGPALEEAADVLKKGGLVAYPTESFYALGADALNPEAVAKVFATKGRSVAKPLPVIVHDKSQIALLTKDLSPLAHGAVELLMPGPVTLVLWASDAVPDGLTGGTSKIGIRLPVHEVASGLARAMGGPVTATSANLSGRPGLTTTEEVISSLPDIDLVLDGGTTPGPPTSTVVDITCDPPRILREGRAAKARIVELLGKVKT